ncbi:MAG: histidinol-phosphatase [Alistipes sp.]|nr:histidinol-phosphatase [Alistipes sp.]
MKRKLLFAALLLTLAATAVATPYGPPNPDLLTMRKYPTQRREMVLPKVKGFTVLTGDFHVHTMYSDGVATPEMRVDEAWFDGIDVLAITDHESHRHGKNYLQYVAKYFPDGKAPKYQSRMKNISPDDFDKIPVDLNQSVREAQKRAEKYGMIIVPGIEITRNPSKIGHYNALFTKDNNTIIDKDVTKSIENARAQKALIMHNHPWWRTKTTDKNELHKKLYAAGLIDGVEVVNGVTFAPKMVRRCVEENLFMATGTDIHGISNVNATDKYRTMTFLMTKQHSLKGVRQAIEKHRTLCYVRGQIIGSEQWLGEFFKACVQLKPVAATDKSVTYALTNVSSLEFKVHLPDDSKQYTISPFRTVQFSVAKGEALQLTVDNMWHMDEQHPTFTLK